MLPGRSEKRLVMGPVIWRDTARVRHAVSILEFCRLQREEFAEGVAAVFAAVGPVFLNRIPKFSQTLIVGITVLDDKSRDAFGMFERQTPADGRSIVHDVDRIARHLQLVEQAIDQFAETVKCIAERFTIGGIALP